MSSGYEVNMVEALRRLSADAVLAPTIRRAHRTNVPKEAGDVIHLIDGLDEPVEGKRCGERVMSPSVVIFKRSDLGVAASDGLRIAVNDRLVAAWGNGIVCQPGRIMADSEPADTDAVRIVMAFAITYQTAGETSLLLP